MDFHVEIGIPLFDSLSSVLSQLPKSSSLSPAMVVVFLAAGHPCLPLYSLFLPFSLLALSLSFSFSVTCTASSWRMPSCLCPALRIGRLRSEGAETPSPACRRPKRQCLAGAWRVVEAEVFLLLIDLLEPFFLWQSRVASWPARAPFWNGAIHLWRKCCNH